MKTRRLLVVAMVAFVLAMPARRILAAPPTVEIVAMVHPPVRMALQPLREWLASQGGKVKVSEIDVESPQGEKRLQVVGLKGHIPIVILIDGRYRHQLKDGRQLAFFNFPAIKDAPPGVRGDWTTTDVQAVLAEHVR